MLELKSGCLISLSFPAQIYSLKPVAGSPHMHSYLGNRPPWLQLIIFVGLGFGIVLVTFVVGSAIVAHLNHITLMQLSVMGPADFARPENAGILKGVLIVQDLGIFVFPPLVFAYLADPHPPAYLGLKAPQKSYFLLLAVIIMIAGYFTVEFLSAIDEFIVHLLPASGQKWVENGEENVDKMLDNILTMKGPRDLLTTVFLVGALPAIGEELFFRGILQKLFIRICRSPIAGIIITGFLFSLSHMQFMGFIPRMALGIILGSLFWYTGSLYASMLGHFLFNSISVFLIYFKVSDLHSKSNMSSALILIGVISLALVVYLLNYLRKKSTTSYAKEFPPQTGYNIFDDPEHPL
jgi:membrane protease YdiL (CAAX protease family)